MTEDVAIARQVLPPGAWETASDTLALDYDARLLRRRRVQTAGGLAVLVDLPQTTNLVSGAALRLTDGRTIAISAASEPLLEVTGRDLPRLAWHIGNRHTPCQIGADRLLIRRDHVLAAMLAGLGARLHDVDGPFEPEGGAYGTGRTMGHAHGPADATPPDHDHDHDHDHGSEGDDAGHSHTHSHTHSHAHSHAHSHPHSHGHADAAGSGHHGHVHHHGGHGPPADDDDDRDV